MNEHQIFERSWWGSAANCYDELTKHFVYARLMGLTFEPFAGPGPVIDVKGQTILDIGGGPVSMLLRTINLKKGIVVDPCDYPNWVSVRYKELGIDYLKERGEDITLSKMPQKQIVDSCWVYNCLQHVDDPREIIKRAREVSKVIRIFEWIDMPPVEGHPHELKEEKLDEWLGGKGKTEWLSEKGCYGRCYYGIFKGDNYGT